jgi:hypothetical protein
MEVYEKTGIGALFNMKNLDLTLNSARTIVSKRLGKILPRTSYLKLPGQDNLVPIAYGLYAEPHLNSESPCVILIGYISSQEGAMAKIVADSLGFSRPPNDYNYRSFWPHELYAKNRLGYTSQPSEESIVALPIHISCGKEAYLNGVENSTKELEILAESFMTRIKTSILATQL